MEAEGILKASSRKERITSQAMNAQKTEGSHSFAMRFSFEPLSMDHFFEPGIFLPFLRFRNQVYPVIPAMNKRNGMKKANDNPSGLMKVKALRQRNFLNTPTSGSSDIQINTPFPTI